ncbi:tyrosine-type recombinase/integrase [Candidatus Saccharibacteria bacterium]|nr:tyrosine-type recombinase/integrase [Candidatus Saccharibacteria bacterium]
MKISEAFDLYKNNYMFVKGLSKRVLENQDYVKNRIVKALGDITIEELTLEDVSRWNNTLHFRLLPDGALQERRNNTIRNDLIRLKMVLRYVRILGHECLNPELIPIPKREDTRRGFLTPEEVDAMIENASSLRNKLVISLFYASGIRLSELIQLDRDSIYDRQFTVVGKGKKMRTCFIDERTEKIMNEYLASRSDNCPALIVSAKYKARMTPTNIQLLIKNSARRAGIEKNVFPHLLRHSFATDFIRKGGNIRYLSPMLGHASINTTLIYTHVVDNDLKKQYEMFHTA